MKNMALAFVLPFVLLGCGLEVEEPGEGDELVGSAEQADVEENALTPNALTPNALTPNALTPNALSPNALTPNALTPNAMAALQEPGIDGIYSRMLVKYLVSCALDGSQSFSFTWNDSSPHQETYWGSLGLARAWETRGLTEDEQAWVSACIAARTNYYGVTVVVSLRGPSARLMADTTEKGAFPEAEGAFWGNIFDASPWIKACSVGANVGHSRSKMRDCAAGHVNGASVSSCGMIALTGECSALCAAAADSTDGFLSCEGVTQVISTYLEP